MKGEKNGERSLKLDSFGFFTVIIEGITHFTLNISLSLRVNTSE